MVNTLAADPAVISAHTRQKADGTIDVPSPAVLSARASVAVKFAVAEMVNMTWVRYQMAVRRRTVTLTDNTFDLESNESEVVALTVGTDKRPIDPVWDPKGYTAWRYSIGQDVAPAADEDPDIALRFHIFDINGSNSKRVVTLEPGIGSDTTAELWYLKQPDTLFDVSQIPGHLHVYVYLVALNYATGFQFKSEMQRVMGLLKDRIASSHGTLDPIPQDPLVEERATLRNREYTDSV